MAGRATAGKRIVSANLERRNLSKGQQAVALAMLYPEADKGRPTKGREKCSETEHFSKARLSQARSVLRHSQALAKDVLAGRGKKGKAAETSQFSQRRLEQARAVLSHSRALAEDVLVSLTTV